MSIPDLNDDGFADIVAFLDQCSFVEGQEGAALVAGIKILELLAKAEGPGAFQCSA